MASVERVDGGGKVAGGGEDVGGVGVVANLDFGFGMKSDVVRFGFCLGAMNGENGNGDDFDVAGAVAKMDCQYFGLVVKNGVDYFGFGPEVTSGGNGNGGEGGFDVGLDVGGFLLVGFVATVCQYFGFGFGFGFGAKNHLISDFGLGVTGGGNGNGDEDDFDVWVDVGGVDFLVCAGVVVKAECQYFGFGFVRGNDEGYSGDLGVANGENGNEDGFDVEVAVDVGWVESAGGFGLGATHDGNADVDDFDGGMAVGGADEGGICFGGVSAGGFARGVTRAVGFGDVGRCDRNVEMNAVAVDGLGF